MKTHAEPTRVRRPLRRPPFRRTPTVSDQASPEAVRQVLRGPMVQAKLKVGRPGDVHEQEAPRIADEVMRSPESVVQRPTEEESGDGQEEAAQAKADHGGVLAAPPDFDRRLDALRSSGGAPLPAATHARIERHLGADLSGVRVHTGPEAAAAADSVGAKAFTAGRDIVFNAGRYAPDTERGGRLLEHELTHVLQQGPALTPPPYATGHHAVFGDRQYAPGRPPLVQCQLTGAAPGPGSQRNRGPVSRDEVEAALVALFERVLRAQTPSRTLRITKDVRLVVMGLADAPDPQYAASSRDPRWLARSTKVEAYLRGPHLLDDPGGLAHQIAQELPERVDRPAYERVLHASGGRRSPSPAEWLKGKLKPPESAPPGRPGPPGVTPADERGDEILAAVRRVQGLPDIRQYGPYGGDVTALSRKARGWWHRREEASAGAVRAPVPGLPTSVEEAIRTHVRVTSLAPRGVAAAFLAASREWEMAGPGAEERDARRDLRRARESLEPFDAQEVARQTAFCLINAAAHHDDHADLHLASVFESSLDREQLRRELTRIVGVVRAALPNQARDVKGVHVYSGGQLILVLPLGAGP